MTQNESLGERIARLRKQLKRADGRPLNQAEFAHRVGAAKSAVADWERNARPPSTENLLSLAQVLGLSVEQLLDGEQVWSPEAVKESEGMRILMEVTSDREWRSRAPRAILAEAYRRALEAELPEGEFRPLDNRRRTLTSNDMPRGG
jgi:transcriptional regulator with XRE-family HTH domain